MRPNYYRSLVDDSYGPVIIAGRDVKRCGVDIDPSAIYRQADRNIPSGGEKTMCGHLDMIAAPNGVDRGLVEESCPG